MTPVTPPSATSTVVSRLLDVLGTADRDALVARLRRRTYRRGQVVFNDGEPGDSLHLVQAGRFAVSASTHNGHSMTLRVVAPGEYFGELALVHPDARRTGRVVALDAGETRVLIRRDFDALRALSPSVDRFLVAALAERVVRTSELAMELLLPPETRIWRRLAALDDLDPGAPIDITQDTLAQLGGTVRPTANRVLRAGSEAGVVEVGRRSIRVLDRARVRELARLAPPTA